MKSFHNQSNWVACGSPFIRLGMHRVIAICHRRQQIFLARSPSAPEYPMNTPSLKKLIRVLNSVKCLGSSPLKLHTQHVKGSRPNKLTDANWFKSTTAAIKILYVF